MSRLMNTAEHEELRLEILELCREAQPYGTNPNVLRAALRKSGHEISERELLTQVDYLKGKGLVETQEVVNRRLAINRLIVRLTAAGTDYLEGNGPDIAGVG